MSITYPLTLPTVTGIASITLRAVNTVVVSESPFTGAQQVLAYSRQRWEADITLPPMKRDDAEEWNAWLTSLRGRVGTFLLGDPMGVTPRGVGGGTPVVVSVTDGTLSVSGGPLSTTGWLKAGDYIQLGSGGTATLHKVLTSVDTASDGTATLELWPYPRRALAVGEVVTLTNTVGKFRLDSNETSWSVTDGVKYGISFSCVEVI